MALNIFPRRTPPLGPSPEPAPTLPEPSPIAVLESDQAADAAEEARKRTRRGSRGGRGRGRKTDETTAAADAETTAAAAAGEPDVATAADDDARPAPRARRSRRAAPTPADPTEQPADASPLEEDEPAPAARPRRGRGRAATGAPPEEQPDSDPDVAAASATQRHGRAPAERTQGRQQGDSTTAILRALEQQNRQIEHLVRVQEEFARKVAGGNGAGAVTRPARVGVFVDSANIELACDRLRARFDWARVLGLLTKDRQLVRAVAYSPVHDDPNVSIETQRFAEPFLDKGFKLVTKAFKRFADGTIKANVDIELALDVVTMLDRLDVVCLVSGDGDFQPLVEYVQRRGVRCEVIGVAQSTAGQLRNAADLYIDLAQRLKEIRS